MTALLVIRHAPTDWNAAGLIQGRIDRPLSEAGRRQAAAMRVPGNWAGARCLASPLQRAMETARLMGLDPIPEPQLLEMSWGSWEGESLAALRARLGAAMAENEALGLDFRPPGGESPRDLHPRLRLLLAEAVAPTIWVTHKGVLRALYALATGWLMTGKPEHKLLDGRAHQFAIDPGGSPRVQELNIPLGPT